MLEVCAAERAGFWFQTGGLLRCVEGATAAPALAALLAPEESGWAECGRAAALRSMVGSGGLRAGAARADSGGAPVGHKAAAVPSGGCGCSCTMWWRVTPCTWRHSLEATARCGCGELPWPRAERGRSSCSSTGLVGSYRGGLSCLTCDGWTGRAALGAAAARCGGRGEASRRGASRVAPIVSNVLNLRRFDFGIGAPSWRAAHQATHANETFVEGKHGCPAAWPPRAQLCRTF